MTGELLARDAIRELLAEYCFRLDAHELAALGDLFEPQGDWISRNGRADGPAGIAELLARMVPPPGPGMRRKHLTTNIVIRLEGGVAHVVSNFLVVRETPAGPAIAVAGTYRDVVVPAGQRWLFRRRELFHDIAGESGLNPVQADDARRGPAPPTGVGTMTRTLTGRVPPDCIRRLTLPRLDPAVLDQVRALEDLTGTLSDAMDDLGLFAAVAASTLRPSLPGSRVVGQAVTVRNAERTDTVTAASAAKDGRMGEHEAYNLAEPGDVVVIEGLTGVSNMGGQSATLAHRSGCAGAVIDGSHRDPQASESCGFPIWSRGLTPVTGKWRLQTVEINGRVRIAGVGVDAGDLVAADAAGVVFIPFAHVAAVVDRAVAIDAGDARQKRDIASGLGLPDLAATRYK